MDIANGQSTVNFEMLKRELHSVGRSTTPGWIALLLLTLIGLPCACLGGSNLYEILEVTYCRGVDQNAPMGIFREKASISAGQALYCWTRIRVLPDGVRMLRSLHRLPVRHAWIRNGLKVFTAAEPSITQQQWEKNRKQIEWMISESKDGCFEWRTHSLVRNDAEEGSWRVVALDANNRFCTLRGQSELPSIYVEHIRRD